MPREFEGVLEILPKGFGFVRAKTPGLVPKPTDPHVPATLVRDANLRPGAELVGTTVDGRTEGPRVTNLFSICGVDPYKWRRLPDFWSWQVIHPEERLVLETGPDAVSMRVMDLFCPVAKGQRGLIVSPPKAGKTMLLQQIGHSIATNYPDIKLLVLLVDERPEEVTEMRRTIKGEVFASSNDEETESHMRLAQLVMEYARRYVEVGKDVVLLLDSLTRLGRAFNLGQRGTGRIMTGGIDASALEVPRQIFGSARNLERGGSLTILATALVETNSRMDDFIFEEFKGTGNMELRLDRSLANERIFPAINIPESSTRREELLFGDKTPLYQALRKAVHGLDPKEAMMTILEGIRQTRTNDELLERFASKRR